MKYTCPKCGKHIELSVDALIAAEYKTVCPQCLTCLEIVGDYAYVPLEDGSLELRREPESQDFAPPAPPTPPQLPLKRGELSVSDTHDTPLFRGEGGLAGERRDPLFDEAVRYLSQCSAITPMMLRDYFNIPIERAQDLITQLERAGCIGPYRGGAPRKILVDHREGLPNLYSYGQRFDPNTQQTDPLSQQPQGGKMVKVNCVGCLFWILLFSLLIFLIVK